MNTTKIYSINNLNQTGYFLAVIVIFVSSYFIGSSLANIYFLNKAISDEQNNALNMVAFLEFDREAKIKVSPVLAKDCKVLMRKEYSDGSIERYWVNFDNTHSMHFPNAECF